MKKTVFLLFVSLMVLSCATKTDTAGIDNQYMEVFEIPGVSKDDAYSMAKLWISESFRSAARVIDMEDPENSTLICKGNFWVPLVTQPVNFSLKIEIKDEKIRITIDGFYAHYSGSGDYYLKRPKELENAMAESKQLAESLVEYITTHEAGENAW